MIPNIWNYPFLFRRNVIWHKLGKGREMKLEVGKTYKTANGYKAHVLAILGIEAASAQPILGYTTSAKGVFWEQVSWDDDGKASKQGLNSHRQRVPEMDIVEEWKEPKKGEMWLNIYDDFHEYDMTKSGADASDKRCKATRLARIKVEWVEGQFDA